MTYLQKLTTLKEAFIKDYYFLNLLNAYLLIFFSYLEKWGDYKIIRFII